MLLVFCRIPTYSGFCEWNDVYQHNYRTKELRCIVLKRCIYGVDAATRCVPHCKVSLPEETGVVRGSGGYLIGNLEVTEICCTKVQPNIVSCQRQYKWKRLKDQEIRNLELTQ